MTAALKTPVEAIRALTGAEAKRVAETEYRQLVELISTFGVEDWKRSTDCPGWDVDTMLRHLLGAMQANASIRENVHQLRAGNRWAKQHSASVTDGLSAIQVLERQTLGPDRLGPAITDSWRRALRGRFMVPGPIGRLVRIPAETPAGKERWTLGFLLDVIYTRDTWMHRIDLSRAVGRPVHTTADHDGRIIADVVADWSRRHRQPFTLQLTGPAGGTFTAAAGGPPVTLDAIEFARTVSGREQGHGLLATQVPF